MIPGSGRSPGEGNGKPLQYLAWRIPWTEKPGGLQSTGITKSQTQLSAYTYIFIHIHSLTHTHTHTHIGCCFRTYWKYYIMHSMHVLSFYNLINFGFQNVCNLRVCKHGIQELFKGLPCMLWSNNNFTSFNIKRGIIYFLSSCVCLFLITEH